MKIAVIGYSGAGKSTLAKFLSEQYNEPVLYLDTVHWLPGWETRPREESLRILQTFWTKTTAGLLTAVMKNGILTVAWKRPI